MAYDFDSIHAQFADYLATDDSRDHRNRKRHQRYVMVVLLVVGLAALAAVYCFAKNR